MAALLALALAGCSSALTVRAAVVRPAQVPVRVFPLIFVLSDESEEALHLADAVTAHLSDGRSEVRRADPAGFASSRDAGLVPPASVAVRIRAQIIQRDRPTWARRQGDLSCGPGGCVQSRRMRLETLPVMRCEVVITVTDGPSGRELQREELEETDEGQDLLAMRLRLLDRVTARALAMVDRRTERVTVALYPVERPLVHRALASIVEGQWTDGRELLERFVGTEAFEALPPAERAIVLYDLGQARRFDPALPPDERFSTAAEALRAAVILSPRAFYADALSQLESHRQSRALLREQEAAMAHNFRIAESPDAPRVPEPPASYR